MSTLTLEPIEELFIKHFSAKLRVENYNVSIPPDLPSFNRLAAAMWSAAYCTFLTVPEGAEIRIQELRFNLRPDRNPTQPGIWAGIITNMLATSYYQRHREINVEIFAGFAAKAKALVVEYFALFPPPPEHEED